MHTVDSLFNEAFAKNLHRDPRSEEYKAGVRAALTYRLHGTKIQCPYRTGTSQADAYFAGTEEGHRIWRRAVEKA